MLKGIAPCISPELLYELAKMGHGDELVLSDAFFPANSVNSKVLRADGIKVAELIDGILSLINADEYVDSPFIMMEVVKGDTPDLAVEADYQAAIDRHTTVNKIGKIGRFEFYERAKTASLVVVTGEVRKYGNIIIKKGVTNYK
ncbi:MAG: L-fucose mutarotase [Spirochaetales bacterium]|jgi:L-fucose mutarotase|nr:L-fucose mutarotase [Spirochaetales bacterium]